MKILVTGAAGFIGSHLAQRLAQRGDTVVGIDNLNAYYDPNLKYARLSHFYGIDADPAWPTATAVPETGNDGTPVTYPQMPYGIRYTSPRHTGLSFQRLDIADRDAVDALFAAEHFDAVMNLAAQAGVRYSITNPMAYVQSNVVGFTNLLEACRHHGVSHLVYASSSSVYGGNTKVPFAEDDRVDNPVSLYAATKKSNELFAHVYSKLYGIPTTGLRFFTVYGPWGRPDMAPMLFSDAILHDRPIKVFNNGDLSRDFTYVDDIVDGVVRVIDRAPQGAIPAAVYNIGGGRPMQLMQFIHTLERALGRQAQMQMLPMQPGDVYTTYADTTALERDMGYHPATTLEQGIAQFAPWYKQYIHCPQ